MRRTVAVSIWLVAVVAGMIAGLVWYALSAPAQADHVVEPTAPITEYTMEVYAYPNFSTHLTKCDGTEVLYRVDGSVATDARFETFVDSPARRLGNPSEHWDETLTFFTVKNFGQRNEVETYTFRASWSHSNIKPHASGGIGGNGPESSQNNVKLSDFAPGTILRIRGSLKTLESGQTFNTECTFIAG